MFFVVVRDFNVGKQVLRAGFNNLPGASIYKYKYYMSLRFNLLRHFSG